MILEFRGEMQSLNKQLNGIGDVSVNGDARNASGVSGIYIISNNNRSNTNTLDQKNNSLWMSSLLPAKSCSSAKTTTVADGGRTAVSPQATKAVTAISNGYLSSASGIPCSVVARNEAPPSTTTTITDSGSARSNTFNDIMSDYHSGSNNYGQNEASSGAGGGGGGSGAGGAGGGSSRGEYHFTASPLSTPSPTQKNPSSNGSLNMNNGSRVKLLASPEDQSNAQTKCSVFRGLVLCICLNVTYANIVRFPRELDQFGSAYLIPYLVLLFLVGLPIILLEISVGQFLGQGANHTWRASPIFKGACIVSRFASWLSSIWVSLQAVLAVAYIGMFIIKSLPFNECVGDIKLSANGYKVIGNSGQECMQKTFLTPFWENPLYFALLAIGLIVMWTVIMFCTHSAKVLRRCIFFFGLVGFALLSALTSWEVSNSLQRAYFPELWPFDQTYLLSSNIWFNALLQVIFATNIGFGVLPMITGKFLYKGDAVRTSVVYLCFNLLINAISVTLFMVQFDVSVNGATDLIELKPITAIYDRALNDPPKISLLAWLVPALIYTLIVISAVVSTSVAIYTSTRLVPRHPNYVISLIALIVAIVSLAVPKFIVARVLDTRIVGTLVISALVFDLIAITWIYGVKNIYTDLEFSIGRPIFKGWMFMWCLCPVLLTGILVWWCSDDDQFDLLAEFIPRWLPILFVLTIILLISCIEIFKQVEYNFFGMICEAAKSAKEWGPADPLARHAWKQWRTVCQDTGRRDFTLRRRGTRDYTHSIKKGQYSVSSKYGGTQNWKSSTPGNSSPNYSGSVFGDSAIEEDISVDKYPGINSQFVPFQSNDGKTLRYSSHLKRPSNERRHPPTHIPDKQHREVVYIRRLSSDDHSNHATRIEITPSNESITYGTRNPIGRSANGNVGRLFAASNAAANRIEKQKVENSTTHTHAPFSHTGSRVSAAAAVNNSDPDGDHVCWRKFSVNAEEYSTEL